MYRDWRQPCRFRHGAVTVLPHVMGADGGVTGKSRGRTLGKERGFSLIAIVRGEKGQMRERADKMARNASMTGCRAPIPR